MTGAWQGKTLVAEGQLTASGGAVTAVKETISRSDDALVIEIVAGDKTSRLRYVRLTDTGACEIVAEPVQESRGTCRETRIYHLHIYQFAFDEIDKW